MFFRWHPSNNCKTNYVLLEVCHLLPALLVKDNFSDENEIYAIIFTYLLLLLFTSKGFFSLKIPEGSDKNLCENKTENPFSPTLPD